MGLGLSSKCVCYIIIYLSNSRTIVSWQAPALDSLDVVSELAKLHSSTTFSSLKGTTNAPWSSLNSTMEATKKSTRKMSSYTGVQFVNKNIVGSTSYDYMFHQPMVDWWLVAWNPKSHEGSHPHSCSDFICGHRSNACYSAVHIIHHDTSWYIKVEQLYGYLWMINSPNKDMCCFCGSYKDMCRFWSSDPSPHQTTLTPIRFPMPLSVFNLLVLGRCTCLLWSRSLNLIFREIGHPGRISDVPLGY